MLMNVLVLFLVYFTLSGLIHLLNPVYLIYHEFSKFASSDIGSRALVVASLVRHVVSPTPFSPKLVSNLHFGLRPVLFLPCYLPILQSILLRCVFLRLKFLALKSSLPLLVKSLHACRAHANCKVSSSSSRSILKNLCWYQCFLVLLRLFCLRSKVIDSFCAFFSNHV